MRASAARRRGAAYSRRSGHRRPIAAGEHVQEAQRLAALAVRRVLDGSTLPVALAASRAAESATRPAAAGRSCRSSPTARCATGARSTRSCAKLAAKPFSDPRARLPRRGRDLSARPHARTAVRRRRSRGERGRGDRAPGGEIAGQRDPAALPARARGAARGGAGGSGRALVASAHGGSSACAREYPGDWESILAAGNERPPLALRVNRRVDHARGAARGSSPAPASSATPAGDAGIIVEPPRPVRELPGYAEGAFSVQDLGAQLAAPLLRLARRAARARRVRGARRQDHAPRRARRRRAARARQRPGARSSRMRENLARLQLAGPRASRGRGRRRRSRAVVGRPPVRSHPRRRAVHGVGRRAPAPRRQVAAPRSGHRERSRGSRRALLDALWPCLAHGGLLLYATCSVFRDENEAQVAAFVARHADALRESLTFAPRGEPAGARNSCLRSPARATIRTDSSTRCFARP